MIASLIMACLWRNQCKVIYLFYAYDYDANCGCELFPDVMVKASEVEFNIANKV